MRKAGNEKGFTLAELLIVVAIIAVLVAVSIPIFKNHIERAKEAYDIYTMRQAASAAVDLFYAGVSDQNSAKQAGLSWRAPGTDNSAASANAWGIYDPDTGKFYWTNNKHVDIYWKNTNNQYIGGAYAASDPRYSIRIGL